MVTSKQQLIVASPPVTVYRYNIIAGLNEALIVYYSHNTLHLS